MKENCQYIKNVFTPEEIELLDIEIQKIKSNDDPRLGRITKQIEAFNVPFLWTLIDRTGQLFDKKIKLGAITYVKYSPYYGEPNLPPHIDRDKIELILDYQYRSNTNWPLGVNKRVYEIEDNSALVFNPNTNIHWRPIKYFKPEEFVEMIFFRFFEVDGDKVVSDYTEITPKEGSYNPVLEEVEKYRNQL